MKKSRLIRTVSTCLVLCVFAGMAMASGSSGSKETGSVTIDDQGGGKSDETTSAATESEKIEYEVTHTTFTHYTDAIKKENYCGIVEITNTGTSYLYLKDCTFDLEDDTGHLLQSDSSVSCAPSVIAPGEKGYFFNNGYIDDGVSLDKGVKLVPNFTIEIAKKGKDAYVDYEVSDLDIRDNDYGMGIKVTGRITNHTEEEISTLDAKIVAIFFDSNGEILDIGYTYPDNVAPGATVSFEISTIFGNTEVSKKNVADYKVIARSIDLFNW